MENTQWDYGPGFQIQVLGLCLRDPQFLSRYIDVIDYSYFEQQNLATLAKLMLSHFRQTGQVPSRDTMMFLIREHSKKYDRDGSEGLEGDLSHWLGYVYERSLDEEAVSTRMVKFAQRQAIRLAMYETVELLQQDTGPIKPEDDLNERIARMFEKACMKGSGRDMGLVWQEIALHLQEHIRNSITVRTKVRTGLQDVDLILNGGVGAEELAVVMGPPNKGKSTFLVCIGMAGAYHLYQRAKANNCSPKAVIHITCEMSALAITTKYGAGFTGMKINDVKGGHPDYVERISDALKESGPIVVKHFLPGKTSVEELKWYIANLKMVKGLEPGLVIVDYADRLKGGEDDRFQGMGQIYDGLIEIAKKFECPVWTGCQVRRFNAKDDLIDETGVAESWKKVEAADIIVSLNQNDAEYQDRVMRLNFAKVRDGGKGLFFVKFDHSTCTLRALTDSELAEIQKKAMDTSNAAPGTRSAPFPGNGNGKSKKIVESADAALSVEQAFFEQASE